MAQPQLLKIDLKLTRQNSGGETERAHLYLETGKHYDGGVCSDATLYWHGANSIYRSVGLGTGGDFKRRVEFDRSARATQKVIDAQHTRNFSAEAVDALTSAALAHYGSALSELNNNPPGSWKLEPAAV